MQDQNRPAVPAGLSQRRWRREWDALALVVLVGLIYCARLTEIPVCGEESRWAGAAREMIASGDWIVPRQQGTVFPERPPLGSWAMAVLGLARGNVDLVAIRLPSALAIVAMALAIYGYAQSWMSRFASFTAAAVYATFGQVLQLGRLGESEALFTLFTAGALLGWHWGYLSGRSQMLTWCLGYSLAAAGALVKGLQAPVYFVVACTVFLALQREWRWLFGRAHACGLLCFAAIVGAWLVPFAATNWSAVDDIWAGLANDRFTTHGLGKHLATYPFETFGCLLPWSPMLVALVIPSVRRSILANYPESKFLLVAVAVTYPTVWLAAGARGRYFMPLYPCLAVLVALVIQQCTAHSATIAARLFWRRFQRVLALVALVSAAVLGTASLTETQRLGDAAQPVMFLLLWIPAAMAVASLLAWASLGERWPRPQLAIVALAALLGLAYTGAVINGRLRKSNDLHPVVARLKQRLANGEMVSLGRVYHRFAYVYDTPIRQVAWPDSPGDLPDDVVYFCFDHRPGDTELVRSTSDGRLSRLTSGRLPFEWDEIERIGCDPRQRELHSRTVIIGRVRREKTIAGQPATQPGRR